MDTCKSCGAAIIWIKTLKGKSMPCNADPVRFDYKLNGHDWIVTGNGEVLPGVINPDGAETGYVSHFASCPNADDHRRR